MIEIDNNYETEFGLISVDNNDNEANKISNLFDLINYNTEHSNNIKKIIATDGSEVIFKFNDNGKITSTVLHDGVSKTVSQENLPSSLKEISTLKQFYKYLEKCFIKFAKINDGEIKINLKQKLLGGGGGNDKNMKSLKGFDFFDFNNNNYDYINNHSNDTSNNLKYTMSPQIHDIPNYNKYEHKLTPHVDVTVGHQSNKILGTTDGKPLKGSLTRINSNIAMEYQVKSNNSNWTINTGVHHHHSGKFAKANNGDSSYKKTNSTTGQIGVKWDF